MASVGDGRRAVDISADVVAGHHIGDRVCLENDETSPIVAGDEIAFSGISNAIAIGADAVVGGRPCNVDADPAGVGEGRRAGSISADVVAGHHVGVAPLNGEATIGIAGDEIAFFGIAHAIAIGANTVVGCAVDDIDTKRFVGEGRRASRIGADVVAGYNIVVTGAKKIDASSAVAGDEVALGRIARAIAIGADAVVGRPGVDPDTRAGVGDGRCAIEIGADVVARHHVGDCVSPINVDTSGNETANTIAGDEVALSGIAHAIAIGADAVVGGCCCNKDTMLSIREGRRASHIGADVVTFDHAVISPICDNAIGRKAVDDQATKGEAIDRSG